MVSSLGGNRRLVALAFVGALSLVFLVYANIIRSQTRWNSLPAAGDDFCYLRQAQLFRSQGMLHGLDTGIRDETARYLLAKVKKLNRLDLASGIVNPTCHTYQAATDQAVLQYPPGTGALLALFPESVSVQGLYIASTTLIMLIILAAALTARTPAMLGAAATLGSLMLYLMINPAKSSFSVAPTMAASAALGFLTVAMFEARTGRARLLFTAAAGLLIGLAINIRIANAFLAMGFLAVFAVIWLRTRSLPSFLQGAVFASLIAIGSIPTLAANAINTGHPFTTPYSGLDTALPDFSWSNLSARMLWYFGDTHGLLLWISIALLALFWLRIQRLHLTHAAPILWLVTANLAMNMAYFLSHPVSSQYYTVPIAILLIWALFFAFHTSERALASRPDNDFDAVPDMLRIRGVLAVVSAVILCVLLGVAAEAVEQNPGKPKPSMPFEPTAVIWASESAGFINYYLERHAAPLSTVPPETQKIIVASVAKDRRPQYFVLDGPDMQKLIASAADIDSMHLAGQAFGYDVYRLDPEHGDKTD